ncbi:hypothetical protein ACOMCU_01580 [Lysinibacillus sp. UGB7]|uniref:hypothetical protein n=1 Tax=Lysinibacillus sp. UGB7 TaxID=3411039 RepID=UPI003B7B3F1D
MANDLATVEEARVVAAKVQEILTSKQAKLEALKEKGEEGEIHYSILSEEIEDCKFLLEVKPEDLADFVHKADRVVASTTSGSVYDAVYAISKKACPL